MSKQKTAFRKESLTTLTFFILLAAIAGSIVFLSAAYNNRLDEPGLSSQCNGLKLNNKCYVLERAETNLQRIKGLSDRANLSEDTGMAFIFEQDGEQCFWMKGMRFNLDIIWMNDQKKIIKIKENTSPNTYPDEFCADDVKYVLEFNQGFVSKHGLKLGTTLQF